MLTEQCVVYWGAASPGKTTLAGSAGSCSHVGRSIVECVLYMCAACTCVQVRQRRAAQRAVAARRKQTQRVSSLQRASTDAVAEIREASATAAATAAQSRPSTSVIS